MPETLGGLAFFAALLVPGFVYLERRESRQAGQQLSPLRETGKILFASLACDAVVIALFAGLRALAPGVTPNVGALVRLGGAFWRDHYAQLALWGAAGLAASCSLAAVAAVPPAFVATLVRWIRPDSDSHARQEGRTSPATEDCGGLCLVRSLLPVSRAGTPPRRHAPRRNLPIRATAELQPTGRGDRGSLIGVRRTHQRQM